MKGMSEFGRGSANGQEASGKGLAVNAWQTRTLISDLFHGTRRHHLLKFRSGLVRNK